MDIEVPSQCKVETLCPLIQRSFGDFSNVPASVRFDLSSMRFVLPSGMVLLSNLTHFLRRRGSTVSFVGADPEKMCIQFMDDSMFFEQHSGGKLRQWSSVRPTTKPLVKVQSEQMLAWVNMEFSPWLARCSGIPERDLAELMTCAKELFNNISDHTELGVGSVFSQWYPQKNRLLICIADFGPGIPFTVRRVRQEPRDEQAIVTAFEDGFTSKSKPTNQGVGLAYLRQNVVENLSGELSVHSGEGAVRMKKNGTFTEVVAYSNGGLCPGTLIEISLGTDRIERSPDEPEAFEW